MKKLLSILLVFTMLLALTSCGESPEKEISLYTRGMELISDIDKMAESDDYLKMMSANPEIEKTVKEIAEGDYTNPEKVLVIKNTEDAVMKALVGEGSLPEDIAEIVKNKLAPVLPSQINALHGVINLASSNILTHGTSFIKSDLTGELTYVYFFPGKHTFMVSFVPSNDGIVNASANVIISEDVASCASVEKMTSFMSEGLGLSGLEIEEYKA